jgi:hypothetical protein
MTRLLMPSPYEVDDGNQIGRDPKSLSVSEWENSGLPLLVGFKAIRAKCLDCCGGISSEVRKCVSVACPLWPLRMGGMPPGLRSLRKKLAVGAENDLGEAE